MEVIHTRCAGIDISKRDAKVCVRVQGSGSRATASVVTTGGAMTRQILALKEHLLAEPVNLVVMKATGDYWHPFYYVFEAGVVPHVKVLLKSVICFRRAGAYDRR